MSKRSAAASRTSRRRTVRTNPLALRAEFHRLNVRNMLHHANDIRGDHGPHGGTSMTARNKTFAEVVIDAFDRYNWCRDVERALDGGIKFLQEYGDQLTQEQRDSYTEDLADLLGDYGDLC